jgi:NADPH:quinone reductase-like Zn-dependent oxidoreductase
MKAVAFHKYGGPDELKYEDFPDPVAGKGEVLMRVSAVSINPFDYKTRSGQVKDVLPVQFPAILGIDVSGVVEKLGAGVESFAPGDNVFALASKTYAQLCVVKAAELARIPEGMHVQETAALPLVTLTGEQLISVGTGVKEGDTVLVAGAVGNVGRSAAFTAKKRGAKVIAGVLRRQLNEAQSLKAGLPFLIRFPPESLFTCPESLFRIYRNALFTSPGIRKRPLREQWSPKLVC